MKPTQSILILLSLFLTFSCDDDTQTNEDTDDMMSLDWILLKKGVTTNFYVESCDGYIECSYYEFYNENNDTYYTYCDMDEYESYNCKCDEYDNECGECRLTTLHFFRVNSCDGYELCGNISYDCCYEYEIRIYQYDDDGNIINEWDDNGNWIGETEIKYKYMEYLFNEYILLWNDDLSVSYVFPFPPHVEPDFDIVIPSYFPKDRTSDCDNGDCEDVSFFHPNCDTPLDTTMTIGSKSILFEKMGWLNRDVGNSLGYIHYYQLDDYLLTSKIGRASCRERV